MFKRKRFRPRPTDKKCEKCGSIMYFKPKHIVIIDHPTWKTLHCLKCGHIIEVEEALDLVKNEG